MAAPTQATGAVVSSTDSAHIAFQDSLQSVAFGKKASESSGSTRTSRRKSKLTSSTTRCISERQRAVSMLTLSLPSRCLLTSITAYRRRSTSSNSEFLASRLEAKLEQQY
jgi:hypothetical protein